MDIYKAPIEIAILVFPFVAFLLTIPFLIHHYRKYGAIPILRSLLFYSLILYLITAYFLVILPLPKKEVVANLTSSRVQLIPFHFIKEIINNTVFQWNHPNTYLPTFMSPSVYTVIFNIFLCLPFGVYLRYYFNKRWYHALIYTFFLSLFFELTQLSGLYGLYPRSYRLFDVDDLMINTFGGLIGFWLGRFFMIFLPPREKLEEISYEKGKRVSIIRRLVALFIDVLVISSFSLVVKIIFYNNWVADFSLPLTILIYYFPFSLILKSRTIGKAVVKIKIENIKNTSVKWYQLFFRNILCYIITIYPVVFLSALIKIFPNYNNIIIAVSIPVLSLHYLANLLTYFKGRKKERLFLYEKLTRTKNISTIENIEASTKIAQKENIKIEENKKKQEKKKKSEKMLYNNMEDERMTYVRIKKDKKEL